MPSHLASISEGDRVRLKPSAPLRAKHPELAEAVATVSSVVRSGSMSTGGEAVWVHLRFGAPNNMVALNVPAGELEEAERIEPRLQILDGT